MEKSERYANGQRVNLLEGNVLTYYFKDGTVKARGGFVDGMMQGDWVFYRAGGALWQEGTFRDNQKHGRFVRYDKKGLVESDQLFSEGKPVKAGEKG